MRYFIIVFLICQASFAFCQTHSITGSVSGHDGHLAYANVSVDALNVGTTTDEDGIFQLEGLTPGVIVIKVSYVGYSEQHITLTIPTTETVEIELEALSNLEEIVVTGSMKPVHISKSPIKVDVLKAEKLATFLPAASSSLIDNMQYISGVQEVIACGVCYTNSLSINGLEGAYTAILVDGTPMYGNLASVYGLNGIPNLMIDRVEVVKGPSSTLYGSEAVAGVINIITKNPTKENRLTIDALSNSYNEFFVNVLSKLNTGSHESLLGINYGKSTTFEDVNQDTFGDQPMFNRLSVFNKWNFSRKSKLPFSVSLKYYFEDRRNGIQDFLSNKNYKQLRGSDEIYGESIFTHRAELFGTYSIKSAQDLSINFSASLHDQNSYYGSDFYEADQSIVFANFLWRSQRSRHSIVAGLSSAFNYYDDNTVATEQLIQNKIINNADNRWIQSVFAQDDWHISESVNILSGLRLDYQNNHGFILSPQFNIKYNPGQWTTLRGNFSTGFRVVNLFTEDHAFVSGQRQVVIAEALEPEKSLNTSMNITHILSLFQSAGTIDINMFYTRFSNKIIPDYSDPQKIIYANTDGHAISKGISVSWSQQFSIPLAINFNAQWQDVSQEIEAENGSLQLTPIEFANRFSAVGTVDYTFDKSDIQLSYTADIQGSIFLPELFDLDQNGLPLIEARPTESKPFSRHHFQIQKGFSNRISIYGGIRNILNFIPNFSPLVGFEDPNHSPGFSPYFDTSYSYAPIRRRTFYLGVKCVWP